MSIVIVKKQINVYRNKRRLAENIEHQNHLFLFSFIILKKKRQKKQTIIEKEIDDLFNFILILKRISLKAVALNASNLKFIIKRLFNTLNDDIATLLILFTSIFKFITRFMINKIFEFVFIMKSFEITRLYQNFILNLFVLLTKVVFIELYEFRSFKKVITDFYYKMY